MTLRHTHATHYTHSNPQEKQMVDRERRGGPSFFKHFQPNRPIWRQWCGDAFFRVRDQPGKYRDQLDKAKIPKIQHFLRVGA
jgi:hypothetical protein